MSTAPTASSPSLRMMDSGACLSRPVGKTYSDGTTPAVTHAYDVAGLDEWLERGVHPWSRRNRFTSASTASSS